MWQHVTFDHFAHSELTELHVSCACKLASVVHM